MPPKKKKRTCRPKGTFTTNYSLLDEKEKRTYHCKAVQTYRGVTTSGVETSSSNELTRSSQPEGTPIKQKVGRPALNEEPMTPNTLKMRIKTVNSERRKKERLSKIIHNSSIARWSNIDNGDVDDGEGDDDDFDDESNDDDNGGGRAVGLQKSRFYELRNVLDSLFLPTHMDNLKCFLMCSKYCHLTQFQFPVETEELSNFGRLTERQLRYRRDLLYQRILCFLTDENSQKYILKYWLEKLIVNQSCQIIVQSWNLPTEYLPKTLTVVSLATDLSQSFLQRHKTSDAQRIQGVRFLIDVARKSNLISANHGDITALSNATNCSRAFAKTVLSAIEDGSEDQLLT